LHQSNYLAIQHWVLGSAMPFTTFSIRWQNARLKPFYRTKPACLNFFHPIFFFGPHILSISGAALSYMFSTKGWSTQRDKSWRNWTMLKANIHQDFYSGKNILDYSKTCFPIYSPIIFWKNSENTTRKPYGSCLHQKVNS
jgi:hypothetical protein